MTPQWTTVNSNASELSSSSTPLPTTFSAAETLRQLESELGDHAHLLQLAPYHELITAPLDEDDAISFRLKFGPIRPRQIGLPMGSALGSPGREPMIATEHDIWIQLHPAKKAEASVGIEFHAYDSEDRHIIRHDDENIGKVMIGFVSAFAPPTKGRWTKRKLVALCKWYFLRKLADEITDTDRKKLEFGISISNAFTNDLMAVCRDFGEQAARSQVEVTSVPTTAMQTASQGSDLSDLTSAILKEDEPDSPNSIVVEADGPPMCNKSVPRLAGDEKKALTAQVAEALIELSDKEEEVINKIASMEQEIERLQQDLRDRRLEQQQLKRQKAELFEGLSVQAAFNLGQEVGRNSAKKRRLEE